jgi:hypothetical protein
MNPSIAGILPPPFSNGGLVLHERLKNSAVVVAVAPSNNNYVIWNWAP